MNYDNINNRGLQLEGYERFWPFKGLSIQPSTLLDFLGQDHGPTIEAVAHGAGSIDWEDYALRGGCNGSDGERGYGGALNASGVWELPRWLQFYRGRFDGCWDDDWSFGTTIGILDRQDPSSACTTVLCFNSLADAIAWISVLIRDDLQSEGFPQPDTAYRVRHSPVSAVVASA